MTDEDIKRLVMAVREVAKADVAAEVAEASSESEKRADERLRVNRDAQVAFNNERDARERALRDAWAREQTAATILAALTSGRMVPNAHTEPTAQVLDDADRDNIAYAVALTDALRAKLAEVP